MSNSIPRLFSLAKQYRKFGTIIISGGSHVDALPREALNSGVDIVVHGEGEETIKELMDVLVLNGKVKLNKKKLLKIKGISFKDKNKYIFTGRRNPIKNLDEYMDPDLTLIKYLKKRWSAIPINKGRGCNWNCEFCVVNKQYGGYKSCSISKVMKQIIKYSDLGYKTFFFTDDNFCQNVSETIELCKNIGEYKRRFGKRINLMVQVRSEIAENDDLVNVMKFAGVKTLAIGFESPINEELNAMKKGVTVEKLMERSKKLSKHFYLHGMFIFGYPTFKDSIYRCSLSLKQRAKEYRRFFKKAKIDTIQVLNAVPLPGSLLRYKLDEERRIFPKEMIGWDKYDGLFLCYDPTPEGLDPYELQEIPKLLMKKQYLGNFFNRTLNYGNWISWVSNTVGFPIKFFIFYVKGFFRNYLEKKREMNFIDSKKKNIFHESLGNAWSDISRSYRNLIIRTYAGNIVRRWIKEYKNMDYSFKLNKIFKKTT